MVDGNKDTCTSVMSDVENRYFVVLDSKYTVSKFCMNFYYYNETGSVTVKIKKENKNNYEFISKHTIIFDKNVIEDTFDKKKITSVLIEFPKNGMSSFCLFSVEGEKKGFADIRRVKKQSDVTEKQYAKIFQTFYDSTRGSGMNFKSCDINPDERSKEYLLELDKEYEAEDFCVDITLKRSDMNGMFTIRGGVNEDSKDIWKSYPTTKSGTKLNLLINGSFEGDIIRFISLTWDSNTELLGVCSFDVDYSDFKVINYNEELQILVALTFFSLLQSLALCNFSIILRAKIRNEKLRQSIKRTTLLPSTRKKTVVSTRKMPLIDPKNKKLEAPKLHEANLETKKSFRKDSSNFSYDSSDSQ